MVIFLYVVGNLVNRRKRCERLLNVYIQHCPYSWAAENTAVRCASLIGDLRLEQIIAIPGDVIALIRNMDHYETSNRSCNQGLDTLSREIIYVHPWRSLNRVIRGVSTSGRRLREVL